MGKYRLISFGLLFITPIILAIIWFRHGNILGAGESGLPFYNLNRLLEIVSHAWATPLLGGSVGIQVATIPTIWLLSRLQVLGVPGYVIQAMFFSLLFIISGISIYLLTKEFFPSQKIKYVLLTVWFYWFNPISLVSSWNRFLYNFMVFWALLPLVWWLFLKGVRCKDYRLAVLAALTTAIFAYALTAIVFDIMIIFTLTYTTLFFFFLGKRKGFYIKYFLTFFTCFSLFNFWWITQLFVFLFSSSYSTSVSQYFTSNDNLSTLRALSEKLGLLSNIFALLHYDFFANGQPWRKLFVSHPLLFSNLLVMALILWVIYKLRKLKEVVFLGLYLAVIIFLMKGINPPFGEIYQFIFLTFPQLQVFRNPFEKFSFLLPLTAAPLFGLAVENLTNFIKIKILKFFVWIFVVGIIGFWAYPFWTGLIFTGYEVKVPDYYKEANDWLTTQSGDWRFISLPLGGEGMNYTWGKPYSGVELSASLFDRSNISFNTSVPYFSELASNLTKYQLDKRILEYLPFISSKYIVWRDDVDFKNSTVANPQGIKNILQQLTRENILSLKYNGGNLMVYEINDKTRLWPKIYISDNLVWSNENDLSNFEGYKNFFNDKFVIINSQIEKPDNIFLKPAKVISSFDIKNTALPKYNFKNKDKHAWIVYQFEIPYQKEYTFQLKDIKEKFTYYFDGEEVSTLRSINNVPNYLIEKEGLHEFAVVGEDLNFLAPIYGFNQAQIVGNNTYKFDLAKTPKSYLIQFDYILSNENIFSQSDIFGLAVFEDIGKANYSAYASQVLPNNNPNQFQTWTSYYSSTPGASTAAIAFLPFRQGSGRFSIEIKNLKISQLEVPTVHLVASKNLTKRQNKTILEWEKVNPTLYRVKINKQDFQPEVLVFSELFDSGWEILGQQTASGALKHLLVNSYANGWWLDKPGEYDVRIEFMPEKIFIIGKIISVSALVLFLIIFALIRLTGRKLN